MTVTLRPGGAGDAALCHAIYRAAVREGAAPLYSEAERRAWAPDDDDGHWMADRLAGGTTWIAEADGSAAGFLTVTPAGHLDFLYVRPAFRGTEVATRLHDALIAWARAAGLTHLTTEASHLARRFLERRGWRVIAGETVTRGGVALDRWRMDLRL